MRMEDVQLRLEVISAGHEDELPYGHDGLVSVADALNSWYRNVYYKALATLMTYLTHASQ